MSAVRVSPRYKTTIEFTTLDEDGKTVTGGKFDVFFRRLKQSRIDEITRPNPDDPRPASQRDVELLDEVVDDWVRTDASGQPIAFSSSALREFCDDFYGMRVLLVNKFFDTLAVQSPVGNSRR